ncbi:MAG: excinuclease ABC subunit UvrA [Gemmatimonadota bacterium]
MMGVAVVMPGVRMNISEHEENVAYERRWGQERLELRASVGVLYRSGPHGTGLAPTGLVLPSSSHPSCPLKSPIRIRGARQHNLRNLDLDIQRGALTVVTGPSGSGKSSLVMDTLFAEGQRRYVESLSTYAKQFLERMEKPDVDRVEGIPPAVALEQRNPTRTSRSTVGTATEVHDYLRLLWARVGVTLCPECHEVVEPDTVTTVVDHLSGLPAGTRFMVAFPLAREGGRGDSQGKETAEKSPATTTGPTDEALRAGLLELGFVRVLADGRMVDLTSPEPVAEVEELLVVVDRLQVTEGMEERLADSVATAFREGDGELVALIPRDGEMERLPFTQRFRCPRHPEILFPTPQPNLFSFNNPVGSCPTCTGFGATLEYDLDLIVPVPNRSLVDGAVDPWTKPRYKRERAALEAFAEGRGVAFHAPWEELPQEFRDAVIHGTRKGKGRLGDKGFKGVIPFLKSREKKRYKQYIRVFLRRYQSPVTCGECGGARVRKEALHVKVDGRSIHQASGEPLDELLPWIRGVEFSGSAARIGEPILRELEARLSFLVDVGLGYLTLDRQTRSLSGGEAQRIHLANSLGSRLVDTLYVLDEPTVGLHPRDTGALLALLERLRDGGNTVVVVEHDPQAILTADEVVELGPGAGEKGGELVFQGTPEELRTAGTATGDYVARDGESPPESPPRRRKVTGSRLVLKGARLHNLDGVDLEIPLAVLSVVSGVSGSGKSTLIHDVFYRALERELGDGTSSAKEHLGEAVGEYDSLVGAGALESVVVVDQSPIGRTPRSNPVTYIKAWDEVRKLFADLPLARDRRYQPRHFSFNVAGGRCEACKGAGQVEIEMVFMADVYVPCDHCRGRRFKPEILDVRYKGINIAQVLALTVDEALRFFRGADRLGRALWQLQQVGLGYLRLGQPATTLSGGEAQRLKVARELAAHHSRGGRNLYLLDEPTTGLSGPEVDRLLGVLNRLVDQGHTVVVIEHNLEVIQAADWVVDMGPGAGIRGGQVVAAGPPDFIAGVKASVTGTFLKPSRDPASLPS